MFEETAVADQPITEETTDQTETGSAAESSAEGELQNQDGGETSDRQITDDTYELPDEQSKVWPDEKLLEYAEKRYSDLAKLLNDQNLPEPTRKQVRQILHDKLNGDIQIKKLMDAGQQPDEEEEEGLTEEKPEPTQQLTSDQQWAQIETTLNHVVDSITDPKQAVAFVNRLAKADGIKDPEQRAVAVTKAMTFGMANALRDLLPAFMEGPNGWLAQQIGSYINQNFEGLGDIHAQNSRASAWDAIRQSDPKFSSLPAFGTPEFLAKAQEAANMVPGFENVIYTDPKTGKPLSKAANFAKKAEAMARIITGNRNAVTDAAKAVETGKRVAQESAQRKRNAQLGAGQSKGQIMQRTGDDPLKESLARLKQDSDPFAVLSQKQ